MEGAREEEVEEGERGEVSGDGEAEKLHFDGGKLNQLCNGGLREDRQIETVSTGRLLPHVFVHLSLYEDQFVFVSEDIVCVLSL